VGPVTAGLFHSWQSCLKGTQTKQQQISGQFMSEVASLWSRVFSGAGEGSFWHVSTPGRGSKVAAVLLRSAVPVLQFAALCMQHAALASGNSTNNSSSSSGGKTIHYVVYRAALLLQPAVLMSLVMIDEWSAGREKSLRDGVRDAGASAAAEKASLQQLTGACALLHRAAAQLQDAAAASSSSLPASTSSCRDNRASSSSSSSSDAPGNRRVGQQLPATASVPAFHDGLLHLLPGGQAYVEAMAAAAAVAANASAGDDFDATAPALQTWVAAAAQIVSKQQSTRCHMCMLLVANHPSSSLIRKTYEDLAAAAPVPHRQAQCTCSS
jgi:hypothetical protein